jgi:hypothetical protein
MKKFYPLEGFAILMFLISLGLGVGETVYHGNISYTTWWIAASINAHSIISLAKGA